MMPQNAARMPASGSSRKNDRPKVCEQRVGIGADGVEGDVAEVQKAREPDHDVEAEGEHHVDQNLDAEIVDPLRRAAGPASAIAMPDRRRRRRARTARTSATETSTSCPGARARAARRSPGGAERPIRRLAAVMITKSASSAEARLQHELVADILDGAEPISGRNSANANRPAKPASLTARATCGARRRGGHVRPSHTFSTSGRPSRPCGMKISVIARIENAATSL